MLFPVYLFVIAVQLPATVRTIQLDKDGGYTDIVIRIANSVPEDSCPKILANIKVIFNTKVCRGLRRLFLSHFWQLLKQAAFFRQLG